MWVIFESIEHRSDLKSKKGNAYSAYVVTGMKKGSKDEPDSPYSKIIFDGTMVDVVDRNGTGQMLASDFFGACKPNDLIVITSVKDGAFWKIGSVENKTRPILSDSAVSSSSPSSATNGLSSWTDAILFVNTLVSNGHYKEKTNPDILLDAVVTYKMRLDNMDDLLADALSSDNEMVD